MKISFYNYSSLRFVFSDYSGERLCVQSCNSPTGYRKISKIFNEEGLKTPRGSTLQNNHIHSIYKKGKIGEERINRKYFIKVGDVSINNNF